MRSFIENDGQLGIFDESSLKASNVMYYSSQLEYYDFISRDKVSFVSAHLIDTLARLYNVNRLDLMFVDQVTGLPKNLVPSAELNGPIKRNYYLDNSNSGFENVNEYGELFFEEIYQKINLSLTHNSLGLKAFIEVLPGADYTELAINFDGITGLNFYQDKFKITSFLATYEFDLPIVYQFDQNDNPVLLPSAFYVNANNHLVFDIQNQDPEQSLYICLKHGDDFFTPKDETDNLDWSSYIGSTGPTSVRNVATNSSGDIFYVGTTSNVNFLIEAGNAIVPYSDGGDAFVYKLNADIEPIWFTFIGGNIPVAANVFAEDVATSVTTDPFGDVYVSGVSGSTNLPMVDLAGNGYSGDQVNDVATDQNCTACGDLFYARLGSTGTLKYSTFYGNEGFESAFDMQFINNQIYIVGERNTTTPLISLSGASNYTSGKGLIMRFDLTNQLDWVNAFEVERFTCLTANETGSIIIGGYTNQTSLDLESNILVSSNPDYNSYNGGTMDGVITVFSSQGVNTHFMYYGGDKTDYVTDISSNVQNNKIVAVGITTNTNSSPPLASTDLPVIGNGLNSPYSSFFLDDHFYLMLDINSSNSPLSVLHSGYYSGGNSEHNSFSDFDISWSKPSVMLLRDGAFAISGNTRSSVSMGAIPFPTDCNPLNWYENLDRDLNSSLNTDSYISIFDEDARLLYTTYFGHGKGSDATAALAYVFNAGLGLNRLIFAGNTNTVSSPGNNPEHNLETEDYLENQVSDYFIRYSVNTGTGWGSFLSLDGLYEKDCSLSTNEISPTENNITIYPNPTNSFIEILSEEKVNKIKLFSNDGRLMQEKTVNNFSIQINVENLAKGTYLLLLETSSGKVSSHKITKL